jgi:CRISPR-associated protein Csh1
LLSKIGGEKRLINDLVQLFKSAYERLGDNIILDSYHPKPGLYMKIDKNGKPQKLVIGKERPEGNPDLYKWFRDRDYYSILVDMNKPVDPKKKIHSNNYLTLFIKKDIFPGVGENSLDKSTFEERVKQYFDILAQPEEKNGDKKVKELMEYVPGQTDLTEIESNRDYILDQLDFLIEEIKVEDFEGYVSLFFDEDISIYKYVCRKYLVSRIFNKNTFNEKFGSKIMGLSNYNMGSNDKKPYLELKTTKYKVPYRVTVEDAIMTKKFFDWLGYQEERELLIPYDFNFEGKLESIRNIKVLNNCYYLYFAKGKEITIEDFEYLPHYRSKIDFQILNVLQVGKTEGNVVRLEDDIYPRTRIELEGYTDRYFFNGRLTGGYFQEPKIKTGVFSKNLQNLLLISRKAFHSFFRKAIDEDLYSIIDKVSMAIVKEHLRNGEAYKAAWAYNLRIGFLDYYSIKGGEKMGDRLKGLMERLDNKISSKETVFCENDEEFYFTAGQLAYFILSKSEAKKKNFDMAEPFLRAKGSSEIKKQLNYMFDRYKHAIRLYDTSFKNAMSMIRAYDTEGSYKEYEDTFIAGLMARNMFYKSSENETEKEEVKKNEDDK